MVIHNKKLKKILIIRLGAIGDVVNSLVIHQAIKKQHPDVELHYMTLDAIAPLLENDKDITKIWTIENARKKDMLYIIKKGLELRKEHFDAVISLTNSTRNIILNICSGAKKVVKRDKTTKNKHAVRVFFNSGLKLFDDLKFPNKVNLSVKQSVCEKIYEKIKSYPRPYIVLNSGGAHDKEREGRIWRQDYWIETGTKLVKKYGGTVFITGSKSEREAHEALLKIPNSVLFSGELSLVESAALYSFSDLFLSIDSGPLHIAAALGVKALAIMGSTSGTECGPFSPECIYIAPLNKCAPCSSTKCNKKKAEDITTPCMSTITPKRVLKKIEKLNWLKDFAV